MSGSVARVVPGETGVETYSGKTAIQRLRLTASEAGPLRYVFGEWAGEVGCSSNFGRMLESLAEASTVKARDRDEGRDHGEQSVFCRGQTHAANVNETSPIEQWCDDRLEKGAKRRRDILAAWRAVQRLNRSASVVLHALYGDLPPGLPHAGIWPVAVDTEYRRVVRYVDAAGGTGATLEALLRVDSHKLGGESDAACRARVTVAKHHRAALVLSLGTACERMIVAASHEYRGALRHAV